MIIELADLEQRVKQERFETAAKILYENPAPEQFNERIFYINSILRDISNGARDYSLTSDLNGQFVDVLKIAISYCYHLVGKTKNMKNKEIKKMRGHLLFRAASFAVQIAKGRDELYRAYTDLLGAARIFERTSPQCQKPVYVFRAAIARELAELCPYEKRKWLHEKKINRDKANTFTL